MRRSVKPESKGHTQVGSHDVVTRAVELPRNHSARDNVKARSVHNRRCARDPGCFGQCTRLVPRGLCFS